MWQAGKDVQEWQNVVVFITTFCDVMSLRMDLHKPYLLTETVGCIEMMSHLGKFVCNEAQSVSIFLISCLAISIVKELSKIQLCSPT